MSYVCDLCDPPFEVRTEHGLKIHRGKLHAGAPAPAPGPARPELVPDLDAESPFAAPPVSDQEQTPKEPTPWRERLWGGPDGKKKPAGAPRPTRERKPRPRRVSTGPIWGTLWTGAGVALVRSGADVPVGNCLQFQAPIVGDILDDAIAGTVLDRVLQPIAGGGERIKKVGNVVALPTLVFLYQRVPAETAPVIEMMLRQVIRENLVEMAKVAKQQAKQEEQYRRALTDLGMDTTDKEGRPSDPIDEILDRIFPRPAPPPSANGAESTYAAAS